MAIMRPYIPYHREILALDGFLRDPVLVFGFQDCLMESPPSWPRLAYRGLRLWLAAWRRGLPRGVRCRPVRTVPPEYRLPTLQAILGHLGARQVQTLDAFDPRADFPCDMNAPVPTDLHDRFNTIIDIGSLEHVFNTRQCLENLFRMLRRGGHILLQAPCNGYCGHGFHTFNPDAITGALESNGFTIRYLKVTSRDGFELDDPVIASHSLLWVVGRKDRDMDRFVVPQQTGWKRLYGEQAVRASLCRDGK